MIKEKKYQRPAEITKFDPTQISPGGYIKNKDFPNNPWDIYQTRANLTNLSKKGL